MSSQDKLEHVLRDIHVMISKSEAYDADRIVVSKTDIFNLIDRLNASIYEIMDEYELTQQSRDRALREKKKEGDKIIWDASRQAEDIYAASVLYTEEALNHLNVIVQEADATIGRLYQDFQDNMKRQQDTIRENHLELKSQLQLLADTEKYLRMIEERNREIERERAEKKGIKLKEKSVESLLKVKPEIRINEEYFRKAGIPLEREEDKSEEEGVIERNEDGEVMTPLEDEGVIESTLKKAEESYSQEAEKPGEKDKKKKDKDTEKNSQKKEKEKDQADGEKKEERGSGIKASSQEKEEGMDQQADKKQEEKATVIDSMKAKLDAEYFKWKDDDFEEKEEPKHEKFSILDKLMGKKRSF